MHWCPSLLLFFSDSLLSQTLTQRHTSQPYRIYAIMIAAGRHTSSVGAEGAVHAMPNWVTRPWPIRGGYLLHLLITALSKRGFMARATYSRQ